jgi:hypothetical protein
MTSRISEKPDMSARAVTVRLKRVSQLRRLCLSLAKAKPADPRGPAGSEKTQKS